MKHLKILLLALGVVSVVPAVSSAITSDDSVISYDQIVDELSQTRTRITGERIDPLDAIKIRGGVGYSTTLFSLELPGKSVSGTAQGIELGFGIDLFSRVWAAEGNYKRLTNSDVSDADVSFSQFDLKLVYRPFLNGRTRLRTGIGLASRYLEYRSPSFSEDYATPSSQIHLGVEAKITRVFSLIAEASYNNSLVDETIDDSSINGSLRVDANF